MIGMKDRVALIMMVVLLALTAGCTMGRAADDGAQTADRGEDRAQGKGDPVGDHGPEQIPALGPADLAADRPLRVVATTSIVGDVVARVGGEMIDLVVLMGPGEDPHTYQTSARDLAMVEDADVIFINGFDFEAGLLEELARAAGDASLVPVSAGIEPIEAEGQDTHGHGVDPHVWFDVHNVEQWVRNIDAVLSERDPANADAYRANADAYQEELAALETFIEEAVARIPAERRKLVTNHDTFHYFARAYGFELIGAVIPSFSTGAEPSAASLSELIEAVEAHEVPAVFVETTVQEPLAEVLAEETGAEVYQLYTDALGPEGSGADSYTGMMRTTVETLVEALSR